MIGFSRLTVIYESHGRFASSCRFKLVFWHFFSGNGIPSGTAMADVLSFAFSPGVALSGASLVSARAHRNLESRASRLYVAFRMRREVEIVNKLGLHARPAAEFVRCVIRFKSTITICKGEESFSAASILEVLSADLDCGARVVLEAIGPDEQEALNQLEAMLLRFRDQRGGAQGN